MVSRKDEQLMYRMFPGRPANRAKRRSGTISAAVRCNLIDLNHLVINTLHGADSSAEGAAPSLGEAENFVVARSGLA
jgi:hypothetical protein